ncbi:hypothetical protein [Arcticibacterium luteifluviistationis]|uniref:Secretion system C-terminal sorting domain-containing protein n=1 Tax=Arcticibacterium luteifluviistationis TaxID=1784714 RepID=A0A2Z4GET3_9BACT|nr:hypothetical protein [Arcticibacterium luteifluviistationis]AWV99498.1 hypothetical protein DJ013_15535 [Arcticibacterium luteifluviistationis]
MKKQFKTIALALFATTLSFAALANTENPNAEKAKTFDVGMYYDYNSGTIKTFIEKQKGDQLHVTFLNDEGEELSGSYLNKKMDSGRVYFDINSLPTGTYSIKVSNGREEIIKPVDISQPSPVTVVKFSK